MAAESTYSWSITAGDTETVEFRITDEDDVAIDVSAYTFTCEIREARNETGTALVTATCAASDTNLVTVSLTATQTRTLGDAGRRRFFSDLQQDTGTAITTLFPITVVVSQDVTR